MISLKKICFMSCAVLTFGLASCSGAVTYTHTSEDETSTLTISGSNISLVSVYDYGTYEQKGTFVEFAYTTQAGNAFTHKATFTELIYGGEKQTTSDVVYFRYNAESNLEFLTKETKTTDDYITFIKK